LVELGRRRRVPDPLLEAALDLDKAYIPARYPNAHPSGSPRTRYTRAEAIRLIEHAAQILEFCSSLLSQL
jgi:HEPN domain-containing protein